MILIEMVMEQSDDDIDRDQGTSSSSNYKMHETKLLFDLFMMGVTPGN